MQFLRRSPEKSPAVDADHRWNVPPELNLRLLANMDPVETLSLKWATHATTRRLRDRETSARCPCCPSFVSRPNPVVPLSTLEGRPFLQPPLGTREWVVHFWPTGSLFPNLYRTSGLESLATDISAKYNVWLAPCSVETPRQRQCWLAGCLYANGLPAQFDVAVEQRDCHAPFAISTSRPE